MSKFTVLQIVNSSLWITVLVVRVGCIIEAHPSPNTKPGQNLIAPNFQPGFVDEQHTGELETAASHSFVSSPRNGLGGVSGQISKKQQSTSIFSQLGLSKSSHQQQQYLSDTFVSPKFSTEATTITTSSTTTTTSHTNYNPSSTFSDGENINQSNSDHDDELDDSCSGKADGYYQNLGSGCTSYYFCTAGYQATYICPIGLKFNGKRCENDYVCPSETLDGHHVENVCENKSNGYYPSNGRINAGKYFYCFQNTKVIELQCDSGKIFVKDSCIHETAETSIKSTSNTEIEKSKSPQSIKYFTLDGNNDEIGSVEPSADANTCFRKSNGFYQDIESDCRTYYYCIGGVKTELHCQEEYVFNGDICVHRSRYECPHVSPKEKVGRMSFNDDKAFIESKTNAPMTSTSTLPGHNSNDEDNSADIVTESGKLSNIPR